MYSASEDDETGCCWSSWRWDHDDAEQLLQWLKEKNRRLESAVERHKRRRTSSASMTTTRSRVDVTNNELLLSVTLPACLSSTPSDDEHVIITTSHAATRGSMSDMTSLLLLGSSSSCECTDSNHHQHFRRDDPSGNPEDIPDDDASRIRDGHQQKNPEIDFLEDSTGSWGFRDALPHPDESSDETLLNKTDSKEVLEMLEDADESLMMDPNSAASVLALDDDDFCSSMFGQNADSTHSSPASSSTSNISSSHQHLMHHEQVVGGTPKRKSLEAITNKTRAICSSTGPRHRRFIPCQGLQEDLSDRMVEVRQKLSQSLKAALHARQSSEAVFSSCQQSIHSTISQASADHFQQQQQQQPPTSSPTFATVIKSSSSPKKNPPVLPSSSSSQTKNNNIQPRAVSESQHRLDLIKRIIERCSESDQVPCNQ
ncbi:unnamed protein product, partial [Notodromas monacha]